MKDFEFSHEAVAKLDEQVEARSADQDEDRKDDDPVEQNLEVPTERSEDEAAEYVQKAYKEKSGLELDDESARDIVSTAREGAEKDKSESEDEPESDDKSDSDDKSESEDKPESESDDESKDS